MRVLERLRLRPAGFDFESVRVSAFDLLCQVLLESFWLFSCLPYTVAVAVICEQSMILSGRCMWIVGQMHVDKPCCQMCLQRGVHDSMLYEWM